MSDLRSQIRRHLESLQAAGVLFIPSAAHARCSSLPRRKRLLWLSNRNQQIRFEARRQALSLLSEEVAKCDKCNELFRRGCNRVFGTGPIDTEVAFVAMHPDRTKTRGRAVRGEGRAAPRPHHRRLRFHPRTRVPLQCH